jgi:hypothetical protein
MQAGLARHVLNQVDNGTMRKAGHDAKRTMGMIRPGGAFLAQLNDGLAQLFYGLIASEQG